MGIKIKRIIIIGTSIIILFATILIIYLTYTIHKDQNDIVQNIRGTLVEMPLDQLMEKSTLVVYGEVSGQSEPFKIQPVFGETSSIFTDYFIKPTEILRGSEPTDPITVRVRGGQIDTVKVVCDSEPALAAGDEVILFLYHPGMGGGYNTEEFYYYVLGAGQGAFIKSSDGSFRSKLCEDLIADLRSFKLKINHVNESAPVDKEYFYRTFLKNAKANLESGFIEREEYDRLLKEATKYAVIVP